MRTRLLFRVAAVNLCLILAGCVSITATTSLWPFAQFDFDVRRHGAARAWLSRPSGTPQGLVVVVQSATCVASRAAGSWLISPGGVLWQQFKDESAFVQFQRPVAHGADKSAPDPACPARHNKKNAQEEWRRSVAVMLAALRAREHLESLPVTYIGIDDGAALAAQLATADPRAAVVVLLSATAQTQLPARLHAPVLIAHAADDRLSAVSTAMQTFEAAKQRRPGANLLIFESLGHDLGLSENKIDCFEAALVTLANHIRADLARDQAFGGDITRFRCLEEG